jgi:hypothetical protein
MVNVAIKNQTPRKTKKYKPSQSAKEYPLPQCPSSEDMENIAKIAGFNADEKKELVEFLPELVQAACFAGDEQKKQVSPKEKFERISYVFKQISKTKDSLNLIGSETGREINKAMESSISSFLLMQCQRICFDPMEPPEQSPDPHKNIYTSNVVRGAIRTRGVQLFKDMLERMDASLNQLLLLDKLSSRKGGRTPKRLRRDIIVTLLNFLLKQGKPVAKSASGYSASFIEAVFDSIKLPTEGVAADIPRALEDLQNRRKIS